MRATVSPSGEQQGSPGVTAAQMALFFSSKLNVKICDTKCCVSYRFSSDKTDNGTVTHTHLLINA